MMLVRNAAHGLSTDNYASDGSGDCFYKDAGIIIPVCGDSLGRYSADLG
jgi:hypothetical protein